MNAQPDSRKSALETTRARLEGDKHRIYEEIRSYPRPIPACDQHFNYLLEERDRICLELARLEEALPASLERQESVDQV